MKHRTPDTIPALRLTGCIAAWICSGTFTLAIVQLDLAHGEEVAPPGSAPVILPSRFINEETIEAQMALIIPSLSMAHREFDPFGQNQDPDAKPVAPIEPVRPGPGPVQRKSIAFSDIINRIRVNAIMPDKGQFLVGARVFRKGDRFPIKFRNKNTIVEVKSVTARQIDFTNTETGEIASVTLNLMPAGMETNSDGTINAPGLQKDNKDAPLDIDNSNNF